MLNRCRTCHRGCTGTHCDDCEDAMVLLRSSDVAMRVATEMMVREGSRGPSEWSIVARVVGISPSGMGVFLDDASSVSGGDEFMLSASPQGPLRSGKAVFGRQRGLSVNGGEVRVPVPLNLKIPACAVGDYVWVRR